MAKWKHNILKDDNGYHWKYDAYRHRVYCIEAELEMIDSDEDTTSNGYFAEDLEDATQVLIDGGYITRSEE